MAKNTHYISNKAAVMEAILEQFGTLEAFCNDCGLDYETAFRGLISTNPAHISLIESLEDAGIKVEVRR
jgi:hypothetical protein